LQNELIDGEILELQVDMFCEEICSAAARWLVAATENPDWSERVANIVSIHIA
jgi:hypothetical protein